MSRPIICWRCPNVNRSRLVSRVLSSIKPKAILACTLNASIGAKDAEGDFNNGCIGLRRHDGKPECCNGLVLDYFY